MSLEHLCIERYRRGRADRLAFGIVGGCRLAEPDGAGIGLLHATEELRQPRITAQQQWQYAGGHGIERTQMPDRALVHDAPRARHHIVGGHARRLVEDQQTVHFPTITGSD